MIVPEYWAEARIQRKLPDRQITVRRFGWSDESQQAAQDHANRRAEDALQRILRGENLSRRERKVRYNGANGHPIREQILERYEDCVVTRNSYGARCLNTPDVFIADIDFPGTFVAGCPGMMLALILGITAGNAVFSATASLILAAFILPLVVAGVLYLLYLLNVIYEELRGGKVKIAVQRVERFVDNHPKWHLKRYRTPNGLRLIALHKLFDPRSEEVSAAFRELGVDPTYVLMCQKQNCFRARLTAKPWRIGIEERLRPAGGVWPIHPERLEEYNLWIDAYDIAARSYSACRYERAYGDIRNVNSKAELICRYHDECCKALAGIEIA